jgi:hypothetical protein
MSLDNSIRELVAAEVARALAPLRAQLKALAAASTSAANKRGPGRPVKDIAGRTSNAGRKCALQGCGRPARSKGYCAAHYQKYRQLERTGRLPLDWKPDAKANSVRNVQLPRGRAGAKAIAAARRR